MAGIEEKEEKRVFVLPGEIAVTRQPVVFSTLLGSCVTVLLYNKAQKCGGMNHFMLPGGDSPSMQSKYGDWATKKLLDSMLAIDPRRENLEAHIYGGAAVVGHLNSGFDIGQRNVIIAEKILKEYGINVVQRRTGGDAGMKIFFDNYQGTVQIRFVQKSELTLQMEAKKKDLAGRKIRVLVVDDSATVRGIISKALAMDDEIHVVGEAQDAFDAREKILELDPDVITLDIIMPKMDGISFLKKLMVHYPKPVIVVSSVAQRGSAMRIRANDIGAVDVVDKEDLKLYQGLETVRRILSSKIKIAAGAHVKAKKAEDVSGI
ncbi:MAG: response regulator [Nitrospinota bacterium]|nr:response regulator [Nitrospinota bacterium]